MIKTRSKSFYTLLIAASFVACVTEFGEASETTIKFGDKVISLTKIDGPYSYTNPVDRLPIIGFVTEAKGTEVVFRDCSETDHTLSRDG